MPPSLPYNLVVDGRGAFDDEGPVIPSAPRIRNIPLPVEDDALPTSESEPEDPLHTGMLALTLADEPEPITAPPPAPLLFDEPVGNPSILHPVLAYRQFGRPPMHHILGNPPSEAVDVDTGFPLSRSVLRAPAVSTFATTLHLFVYTPHLGQHWISLHSPVAVTVGHVLEDLHIFLHEAIPLSAWDITQQSSSTFLRVRRNFENRVMFELGCTLEEATSRGEPIRWIDTLEGCVSLLGLVEDSNITSFALREGRCEPGDHVFVVVLGEDTAIRA